MRAISAALDSYAPLKAGANHLRSYLPLSLHQSPIMTAVSRAFSAALREILRRRIIFSLYKA